MALDTRYRPQVYADVLGQQATVSVLKQFVVWNRGYHQSYVFCGQHGSGKTTLGRILARALLCSSAVDGAPCDECESCLVLLRGGTHECFVELDAATKSGKSDIAQIIEDLSYSTVSGKRRIYLFDESHRLSKQALDALLKPMEDSVPGSEDKRLVCIFCTTEPEKMVNTIFSRCAPAFVIRPAASEAIVERLAYICDQESIKYEADALTLIAEQSGSHIRDAIKMIEGVSMLGGVTRANAFQYLHLDINDTVLDLLEALGEDLPRAIQCAGRMMQKMSPSGAYERIADATMLIYRVHLGVSEIPMKWDTERITRLAGRGSAWLNVAQRFAAPPHRPTQHTMTLDTASAHHLYGTDASAIVVPHLVVAPPESVTASPTSTNPVTTAPTKSGSCVSSLPEVGRVTHVQDAPKTESVLTNGVYIDPRAVGGGPKDRDTEHSSAPDPTKNRITPAMFRQLVLHHLQEMKIGRTGRDYMART